MSIFVSIVQFNICMLTFYFLVGPILDSDIYRCKKNYILIDLCCTVTSLNVVHYSVYEINSSFVYLHLCVLANHHTMRPLSITDGIGRWLRVTRQPENVCILFSPIRTSHKTEKVVIPQEYLVGVWNWLTNLPNLPNNNHSSGKGVRGLQVLKNLLIFVKKNLKIFNK